MRPATLLILAAPGAAMLTFFFLVPLVAVSVDAFADGGRAFARVFGNDMFWTALRGTIVLPTAASIFSLLVGFPVALHLSRVSGVLDTATLHVTRAGREVQLSPIGLKLLAILMRESPRVVSRRDIEREIWGDGLPDSDTLRSHLYNLRKAIDKPFEKQLLHTIHSAGYRLADIDTGSARKSA